MTRSVIMSPLWVCMLFFVAAYAETDVCISNKLFFKECDEAAIRAYSKGRKWTTIQRRISSAVDFYRGWDDYENGFGIVDSNFWIGLKTLHLLTKYDTTLLVVMEKFDGTVKYAEYSTFKVAGADENYKLTVTGYSGDAGDSFYWQNGREFTTYDADHDLNSKHNCAERFKGAWWYNKCHVSNLNGLYYNGKHASYADGVNWKSFSSYHESLKSVRMLISIK